MHIAENRIGKLPGQGSVLIGTMQGLHALRVAELF